jgi:hypothetical protein
MSDNVGAAADATRAVLAGIVGGTISQITGGKFANGAVTAATAQIFNCNNALEEEHAKKMSANMDKWLKEKYPGFPDTKNLYTTQDIPVDAAPPPNFNILSLCVNEQMFENLSFHEKLHVYIFKEVGVASYLGASNTKEIHDWITKTASALGLHYQGVAPKGASMPDLKNYPKPKYDYFEIPEWK